MKRIVFVLVMVAVALASQAQKRVISGTIVEQKTGEALIQSTVQLLKSDSTYVVGTVSNESGKFSLTAPADGKYIVKITNIAYSTIYKDVAVKDASDCNLGKMEMKDDAVMLKEAVVTTKPVKVVLKNDTFIYNAEAYRTPEGSVLEELVRRLPGASIDDDGNIKINGKSVKKILVDGKEFMVGDTKTAMKNIPTSIVERVKAYDQKSDLARITGIDDGEEQTVLDFGLKRGMNKGMFANADVSIGTHDRYAERMMGALMQNEIRTMLFANANNVNDKGYSGGGGGNRRGNNGLNATKMLGGNFNYEKRDKFKLDGSVRWNHSDSDTHSEGSSENFVAKVGSFSNNLNQKYGRSDSWNTQMRLEWMPDSMTNIMFRPSFSYNASDGRSFSNSASYNSDPYEYVTDPLDPDAMSLLDDKDLMVNRRNNKSISYNDSKNVGGMLQINRKLGNKGRNVTLRVEGNYKSSESKTLSTNNVHLYQVKDAAGNDSTYQTNRYNLAPSESYSYALQTTYSEPLWKAAFLQFSYKFNYSYSKSDRSTYDFSNLGEDFFSDLSLKYRDWDSYLNRLEHPYTEYLESDLSRYSEYKNYTHDIQLMFRMIGQKYNLSAGVMMQPQRSNFIQRYQGLDIDTVRNVVNFAPTLDFRFRFSKQSDLRINYRGTTSQPSISDMLDITDDSDPLYITKGNPGLKPSFTNSLRAYYRGATQKYYRTMSTYLVYENVSNKVSNKVTYNETTGGRVSMPVNVNGNWNLRANLMLATALDSLGTWNVSSTTDVDYANNVNFVSLGGSSDSQKNLTRAVTLGENLAGSFRNSWLEIELDGTLDYQYAKNKLQSQGNMKTWSFAYGGSVSVYAPWGMSLNTNLHERSRRGYSDNSMNTDELIWNAQLSQSFLKGNALTISLQMYDILGQQSSLSRSITAMQRSDTRYNNINSYAMLHATYRFNAFGGKNARPRMDPRRDDHGPRDMDRRPDMRPDMRREGGFGGPGGSYHGGGHRF